MSIPWISGAEEIRGRWREAQIPGVEHGVHAGHVAVPVRHAEVVPHDVSQRSRERDGHVRHVGGARQHVVLGAVVE